MILSSDRQQSGHNKASRDRRKTFSKLEISCFFPRGASSHLHVFREALRKGETVTNTGEHGEEQTPALGPKHLPQVSSLTKVVSVLVRSPSKYWGSERLEGGSIVQDKVDVVTEQ